MDRALIAAAFRHIQGSICASLEELDGAAHFRDDPWAREEGGGGLTRTIASGDLIEKGGVNFSEVFGSLSPSAAKALKIDADQFYATGVSIVLHAHNPWVPTIHMNIRYFEAADQRWFGGGIDLTPSYVDPAQATLFHTRLKGVCDRFDPAFYPDFKRWADDYFYLPHREETRGVGGIFYDRIAPSSAHDLSHLFDFTCAVGEVFAPLYADIAGPVRNTSYSPREVAWQQLRRGRYVEFNLVHDRGTKFGLETGGRTESILMSLPPLATWQYDHRPEPGSAEAETLSLLRKGISWG
jgi:coproporphyrinogen III oxidase